MPRVSRKATHAGSWYDLKGSDLSKAIMAWLAEATSHKLMHARAIIAPHAGYRYCGHVMAYAYKQIDPAQVSRVFLLGPSHHVHVQKCVLSSASHYSTPLGDMTIDKQIYHELQATGLFDNMNLDVDEAEHSLELHMPFIVATLGTTVQLVPIMVGSLSTESEGRYGAALAPYMDDPSNLFIISSDFCHWGTRFSYTFHDTSKGPIYKSIEWLDREGMGIIEKADPKGFSHYLQQYGNTICGRHPIGVFLNIVQRSKIKHSIKFNKYDQSSQCKTLRDSSVSYAAAVVTIL